MKTAKHMLTVHLTIHDYFQFARWYPLEASVTWSTFSHSLCYCDGLSFTKFEEWVKREDDTGMWI